MGDSYISKDINPAELLKEHCYQTSNQRSAITRNGPELDKTVVPFFDLFFMFEKMVHEEKIACGLKIGVAEPA